MAVSSGADAEACAQQLREERCISAQMAQPRCFGHLRGGRRPPIDIVAGFQPDLANELALRPAIAFAKRMSRIDLAEKPRGAPGEGGGVQSGEVVPSRELFQDLSQRRFEECRRAEEVAALGYVHGPKVSCPSVNILEDISMNRLEVRNVEFPGNGSLDQLRNAPVRAARFKTFQQFRVS